MARCTAKTSKGIQCENIAVKGRKLCNVHLRRRGQRRISFSIIGGGVLLALGFIADVVGIFDYINIKPPISLSTLLITSTSPMGNINLVTENNQRIIIKTNTRTLSSGDIIKTREEITVTFSVINNSMNSSKLMSLVIGARGPGVTCEEKNEKKWTAPNISFPSKINLTLDLGQVYKYQGSRAFYEPGNYFLEPVLQDANGKWGGIPPFSCFNISVINTE